MSVRWSDKDPQEIVTLGWDLTDLLGDTETLSAATCSIAVLTGTDATPGSVLLASPSIDGATVWQMVQAGVAGVDYRLAALIDTSAGNKYLEVGVLRVAEKNA